MQALSIANLTIDFGGLTALSEVSMSVQKGARHGVIGPNGAGKTTLFNFICGDLQPTSGKISLFGKDVTSLPAHNRVEQGLGRTFQKMNVFMELTVMDNVRLAIGNKRIGWDSLRIKELEIVRKAQDLTRRFGLEEKTSVPVKHLSYGEQRVMEILLALAIEPSLLLLDEPMAGLSAAERISITSMIKQLPKEMTIIVIEHDMDVIFDVTEQMTVLHYGRVIADGPNSDILKDDNVQEIYLSQSV
jgi:branched-chain amino acid transport system ATP-binding protein